MPRLDLNRGRTVWAFGTPVGVDPSVRWVCAVLRLALGTDGAVAFPVGADTAARMAGTGPGLARGTGGDDDGTFPVGEERAALLVCAALGLACATGGACGGTLTNTGGLATPD